MISVRTKAAVLGIVVALVASLAAPLFAAEAHAMCAARDHGCGATARLVQCCCPDGSHRPADSAPAPAKVEIARSIAVAPIAAAIDQPVAAGFTRAPIQSSPPHFAVLDLQSLFSSFLI